MERAQNEPDRRLYIRLGRSLALQQIAIGLRKLMSSSQNELRLRSAGRQPCELEAELTRLSGLSVSLIVTRNRVSMASVRFDAKRTPRVRLQEAFLNAPDTVIAALAEYLVSRSAEAWAQVRLYALSISGQMESKPVGSLCSVGRVHDLGQICRRVNTVYFGGRLACRVGWGRRGTRRRRARSRTIRFGSYHRGTDTVRINPLLDDTRVPVEFVEYVIFHELLHAAFPARESAMRRHHHHAFFRKWEARFPDYERMNTLAGEFAVLL